MPTITGTSPAARDRELRHTRPFLPREIGVAAGAAERADRVHAGLGEAPDEALERGLVDAAGSVERRQWEGAQSGEHASAQTIVHRNR